MEEEKKFITKDLFLAVFLIALNKEIELKKDESDGRFSFIFTKDEEVANESKRFYQNEALVDPMKFGMAMRQIKSRIHNFS